MSKTEEQTNQNKFPIMTIVAVVLAVLLLCSLCVNAFLAFSVLNTSIRVTELEGSSSDEPNYFGSSTSRPNSAPTYEMLEQKIEVKNEGDDYRISCSYPQISVNGAEFEDLNDDVYSYVTQRLDSLKKTPRYSAAGKSTFECEYQTYFMNTDYFSVVFEGYDYVSGSAHGVPFKHTFNYSMETAARTDLQQVLGEEKFKKLSDYAIENLKNDSRISSLETLRTGAAPKLENYESWYFSKEDELTIYFPVYQVAAYAAGPVEFVVPLSALN